MATNLIDDLEYFNFGKLNPGEWEAVARPKFQCKGLAKKWMGKKIWPEFGKKKNWPRKRNLGQNFFFSAN